MRVLLSFVCVAFALGLVSCSLFDQGGQTTVEGVVVDDVTGQPIGLADVAVLANQRSSSSSALSQVGDWHPTDAQGRFSFAFEANGDTDYVLRADSRRGATQYLAAPKVKGGRKNKGVRVPLTSLAWLQVHLRDVPPRTDALNIKVWGFWSPVTVRPPQDTVFYRPVGAGEGNVVVLYRITDSESPKVDTIIRDNPSQIMRINAIVKGPDGLIWIGTSKGIKRFSPACSSLGKPEGNTIASHTYIYCLYPENAKNKVWVGAKGLGLFNIREKEGQWLPDKFYTRENGLSDNNVYAIRQEPKDGSIWVSSNQGLSRFLVNENRFLNYNQSDNLPTQEFNLSASTEFDPRDSTFLFGGINGFTQFKSLMSFSSRATYPMLISRLGKNESEERISISSEPGKEETWDNNYNQLRVILFDYSNPTSTDIRFKLDGWEAGKSDYYTLPLPRLSWGRHSIEVETAMGQNSYIVNGVLSRRDIFFVITGLVLFLTAFIFLLRNRRNRELKMIFEFIHRIGQYLVSSKSEDEFKLKLKTALSPTVNANSLKSILNVDIFAFYQHFKQEDKDTDILMEVMAFDQGKWVDEKDLLTYRLDEEDRFAVQCFKSQNDIFLIDVQREAKNPDSIRPKAGDEVESVVFVPFFSEGPDGHRNCKGVLTMQRKRTAFFSRLFRGPLRQYHRDFLHTIGNLATATYINIAEEKRIQKAEADKNQAYLEKKLLESQRIDLESQVLTPQMNAHFIRNSLRAMEHHITDRNYPKLRDFAERMEQIFDYHLETRDRKELPIREEAQFLQTFCEFYKIRLDFPVDFEIRVLDDLEEQKVPSLLIQPYVENALIHGIKRGDAFSPGHFNGFIRIVFFKISPKFFECRIEDNGPGVSAASTRSDRRDAVRHSLQINADRINVINQLNGLTTENGLQVEGPFTTRPVADPEWAWEQKTTVRIRFPFLVEFSNFAAQTQPYAN